MNLNFWILLALVAHTLAAFNQFTFDKGPRISVGDKFSSESAFQFTTQYQQLAQLGLTYISKAQKIVQQLRYTINSKNKLAQTHSYAVLKHELERQEHKAFQKDLVELNKSARDYLISRISSSSKVLQPIDATKISSSKALIDLYYQIIFQFADILNLIKIDNANLLIHVPSSNLDPTKHILVLNQDAQKTFKLVVINCKISFIFDRWTSRLDESNNKLMATLSQILSTQRVIFSNKQVETGVVSENNLENPNPGPVESFFCNGKRIDADVGVWDMNQTQIMMFSKPQILSDSRLRPLSSYLTNAHIQPIIGDGNCMYRAVAVALGWDQECHREVRTIALRSLKNASKEPSSFFPSDLLDEYTKNQEMDGTFGEIESLYALSNALARDFIVYNPRSEPAITVIHTNSDSVKPYIVLKHVNVHYELIVPNSGYNHLNRLKL